MKSEWLDEAQRAVTELERSAKASAKEFYGVPVSGGKPSGDGARQAERLAVELEALARRARGLVRA